jgi:hypothetical protein
LNQNDFGRVAYLMPNTQVFFVLGQQFLEHSLSITFSMPPSILTYYGYSTGDKYGGIV